MCLMELGENWFKFDYGPVISSTGFTGCQKEEYLFFQFPIVRHFHLTSQQRLRSQVAVLHPPAGHCSFSSGDDLQSQSVVSLDEETLHCCTLRVTSQQGAIKSNSDEDSATSDYKKLNSQTNKSHTTV